ncbi:glycine--tRNA ligase [bacterium]|jgi:glycyl-tRNA synthetase|nr:glycine--tRNA ligase [bacterium]
MEKLVSLCKRRGFVFPSSEIYGGLNGCWDYGPLGVELKRNIKEAWWKDMVAGHDDVSTLNGAPSAYSMVGVDCSILMNPQVWVASGHVGGFSDPMVDCKGCKGRFRADQIADLKCPEKPSKCVGESDKCQLTDARAFNLMFKTNVGALEDSSSIAYLRPETAQGIFVNFKNVCDTSRVRVPFGIAQIGKAFRNEINPRNFTFRSREFEQMEIEFFCSPESSEGWYQYWRNRRYRWYTDLGLKSDKLILRDHHPDELAHYAKGCADVEYEFPFGVSELEGIANRTDFDLRQHMQHSGKDLNYFDDQEPDAAKRRFVPYVIEPSAGADRATLAFLCEAYHEDQVEGETRIVMRFHPRLAPIKAAILPLVKKEGMPEKAAELYRTLRKRFNVFYDEKGAIGRRYRRQDEVGTPYCITVDGQTLSDATVTVRDRDSLEQSRVAMGDIPGWLAEKVTGDA